MRSRGVAPLWAAGPAVCEVQTLRHADAGATLRRADGGRSAADAERRRRSEPSAAAPEQRRRRSLDARPVSSGRQSSAQAAPFEPTDLRFPINLATALRLSDARPLIVAAAQARIWVAEAELTQAKVLWIPDLNIGFDYIRHDGGGPDFNKGIMTAPEHQLLLRRCRPLGQRPGDHPHDRRHLPAPGGPAGPERPALGHPDRQERRPAPDRRRLLHGAPVPGDLRRRASTRSSGRATWSSGSPHLSRDLVPRLRGRPGPQHARRPRSSRRSRRGSSGGSRAPGSRRCCGSTPARWSSRWSTTTPRSP